MNLGDQLKAATVVESEFARRAALLKAADDGEKNLEKTLFAQHFFDHAYHIFAHRLMNEQLPGKMKLGGPTFREAATALGTSSWHIPVGVGCHGHAGGRGVWSAGHPLFHVWNEFLERCKAAGLEPEWSSSYNGNESWYELTVTAAA
jgi:hypothetical protein